MLTSHADTLQIAQCFLAGADPRTFETAKTAKIVVEARATEMPKLRV